MMRRTKFNAWFHEEMDAEWPGRFSWQLKLTEKMRELEESVENL